jgi:hypothetical protein
MKRFELIQAALVGILALSMTGCPTDNGKKTPETDPGKTPDTVTNVPPLKTPITPKVPINTIKQSEMKSPWRLAKVGDWCEFSPHFVGTTTFRYEVTMIGEGGITFTVGPKGKDSRAVTQTFEQLEKDFHPPETLQPPPKIENKELKTAHGTLKCIVYSRKGLSSTTETWLCMDFPINGGVVRSIREGKLTLNLKAWHKVK